MGLLLSCDSGSSRGEAISSPFSVSRGYCIPWLTISSSLPCYGSSLRPSCLPFIKALGLHPWAHPSNSGYCLHLNILTFVTPAKPSLPREGTLSTASGDEDVGIFWGGYYSAPYPNTPSLLFSSEQRGGPAPAPPHVLGQSFTGLAETLNSDTGPSHLMPGLMQPPPAGLSELGLWP